MKNSNLIILFLISLFSTVSMGQEEEENTSKSLKIYSSFQYLPSNQLPTYFIDPPNFFYNSTAIGYYKGNEMTGKYMEFGLSFGKRKSEGTILRRTVDTNTINNPPIMFITSGSFATSNDLNVGIRFEMGKWIKSLSKGKVKVGVGGLVHLFGHFSDLNPTETNFFTEERQQYYLTLGVVPRIRYDLNSKVNLAIQFPFEMIGVGLNLLEIDNPALADNQRTQGGFDYNIGGEALIRLGIGINI